MKFEKGDHINHTGNLLGLDKKLYGVIAHVYQEDGKTFYKVTWYKKGSNSVYDRSTEDGTDMKLDIQYHRKKLLKDLLG
jgi:hypothetical protein